MDKNLIKLTESAILVALAVAMEFISKMIPILQMPQGGSVSLAMLPIIIIGYKNGLFYGVLSGLTYGIINFLIDGYAFHWGSFAFDYTLAFMSLGLTGIIKNAYRNKIVLFNIGILVVGFFRFIFHVISGVFFFEAGIWGSVVYNGPYMLGSIMLCMVVGSLIYHRLGAITHD